MSSSVVLPLSTLAAYALVKSRGVDPASYIQEAWREHNKIQKAVRMLQKHIRGDLARLVEGPTYRFFRDGDNYDDAWRQIDQLTDAFQALPAVAARENAYFDAQSMYVPSWMGSGEYQTYEMGDQIVNFLKEYRPEWVAPWNTDMRDIVAPSPLPTRPVTRLERFAKTLCFPQV